MNDLSLVDKKFRKIAYKKFRKGKMFSRKGGSSDKKGFRKTEGKGESLTEETTQMSNATIVVKEATYLLTARKEKVIKARHLSQRREAGQTLQILKMR